MSTSELATLKSKGDGGESAVGHLGPGGGRHSEAVQSAPPHWDHGDEGRGQVININNIELKPNFLPDTTLDLVN